MSALLSDIPASPAIYFNRVSGQKFQRHVRAVVSRSPFYRNNLSLRPSYRDCECWLAANESAGFAVSPDRELLNVFALVRGQGHQLVSFATARYSSLQLNCFAGGYLENFYAAHGFEVFRRLPNWAPGGPDVVLMRRGAVNNFS